ncbi:MFS general substrate transporter [Penicillium atrosanguineum]|uniref:Uncharacterized protein n=1 Tax=Penicillium atrosanguineum TaxID=1132637 RepID=A0A9W9PVS7_9EURO|nr:MFS general substrate transporter [Penicillium atrosanguineum]KAJ5309853.1 MFS general substrate transporter [Penicillium atrosanguineum]KAJ5315372.1 hypothetical protein N7476_005679 [Penicillium atrosanguineum]
MASITGTENHLPKLSRFITTHDADAKAVFHKGLSEDMPVSVVDGYGYTFCLAYATNKFPVRIQEEEDVHTYSEYLANPPAWSACLERFAA